MQTSGTFPQLSDGVRKTVTTTVPAPATSTGVASGRRPAPAGLKPAAPPPTNPHRRGGFAKHTKAGK